MTAWKTAVCMEGMQGNNLDTPTKVAVLSIGFQARLACGLWGASMGFESRPLRFLSDAFLEV